MKKYLLALMGCCLFFSSFSAGIKFVENKSWKEILAIAKKENKLIFLDAYATWCGPCKYLQKDVFTNEEVGKFFNDFFINVKMDMEKGEGIALSQRLKVTAYPTLFFINGDGTVMHKYVGALDVEEFISLGMDAIDQEKQQYKTKASIASGKMLPSNFHTWIHTASGTKDPDVDSLVSAYLSTTTYPLLEKEMLSIIFDHADLLSKEKLDALYRNRSLASKILEITPAKYDAALLKKISAYAYDVAVKTNDGTLVQFKKTITSFYPSRAATETQKARISLHFEQSETKKGLDALAILISTPAYNLAPADLTTYVLRYIELILSEKREKDFLQRIQAYKVPSAHLKESYFKNLTLAVIHYKMNDMDKMKVYANKICADKSAPAHVKKLAEEMLQE